MRAPPAAPWRPVALLGWIAFVAATQHWRPWADSVYLEYATDVVAFETIARAAPGFPDVEIQTPHSDRFPAHWLVGVLADATGLDLHLVYAIATGLTLAAAVLAVHAALRAAGVGLPAYALAIGVLVASAYPVRYLLAAPGMLTDALFVAGLAVVVYGLVARRFGWVLLGLAVATIGRQTMLPAALVVAVLVALEPAWRARRVPYAALCVALPVALYLTAHEIGLGFADTTGRGIVEMSLLGGDWGARELLVHLGRAAIVVVLPLALLAAAWRRTRERIPLGLLALGAAVWGQAVALAPDWTHAEPRLGGVALPAFAVAVGAALRGVPLGLPATTVAALGIALASLHHLYTRVGIDSTAAWGVAVAVGSLLAAAAVGLRAEPRGAPAASAR